MTQSKKDIDPYTVTIGGGSENDYITIDLNNTYGATTTYLGDSMNSSYTVSSSYNDTITISDGINSTVTLSSDWSGGGNTIGIDLTELWGDTYNEKEIEKMCKEYPSLEKVWKNFKSVYDMVKQDYEGKKKAGELDE